MMKRFLFLFFLLQVTFSHAQVTNIDSLVKKANDGQLHRLKHIFGEKRDSVYTAFDSIILRLFAHPGLCRYHIDTSLHYFLDAKLIQDREEVVIAYAFINNVVHCASDDNKVRVFSWDANYGGCGHSYAVYYQVLQEDGSCSVSPDTIFYDNLTGIYKIDIIVEKSRIYYLLFGYGATCGSRHYKSMKIYELADGKLLPVGDPENSLNHLFVQSNRSQKLLLEFDPLLKELVYREYQFNGDTGFYSDESVLKTLIFKNGEFTEKKL